MDSILHYTSVSHAGSLMQGVNKMRVSSDLCDVTVVVGDYRILAHKIILSASSPFFCQMLKLDTRSETSKFNEIFLDNVDEIAALKIIEFCYTSAISLDDSTVWPLLEAAIKFQLQEICSLCCEFLTAGLDVSNCVLSLRLAARLHFPQLEENCVRFMVDNLQKASKSTELTSLTPQELSNVLSVLEIHGNHIQVIATLTQAWLNWDRKSRIDFVPMLKLLLPKLGDHFQHLLDDDNNDPGQDSSEGTSAGPENGGKTHVSDESEDESEVDPASTLSSKSSTWSSSFLPSPQNVSLPDSDGKAKDTAVNTSSVAKNKDALGKGKDYICISCGDEFECKNDLSTHGHLCDESVNKIKNVRERSMSPLPARSNQSKGIETLQSDLQDKTEDSDSQNTNLVNISKPYIKIDGAEDNKSVPSDRTYPKLRRSPRGHKPDFKVEDFGEKKFSSQHNFNSFPASDDISKEESGSLYGPDHHSKENKEQSLVSKKTETGNEELLEEPVIDTSAHEAKSGIVNRHDNNGYNETPREQGLNTDDNNNNDAVVQGSTSTFQSIDSNSKNDTNDGPISLKASDKPDQTTVTHESTGDKTSVGDEEVQENNDSFTLKQWRKEHHNSPVDKFIDSTPKHKCLICSRGFWDRKSLTNHWRQDHGVRSFVDEEEDNSSSDHEFSHSPSKVSKRKCQSPKHAYPSSYKPVSNDIKSNSQMNAEKNKPRKSFNSLSNTDLNNDCISDEMEKSCPKLLHIKEEIKDERTYPASAESLSKNCGKNTNIYQHNSSGIEKSQAALKPYENVNIELSHPLNTSFENKLRNPYWPPENSDPGQHSSSSVKSSQNVDQTANEFLTSYINHYNKLAEWCLTQGTQYCPLCLGYHPVGKQCPKAVAHNGTHDGSIVNSQNDKGDYNIKEKDPEVKESAKKAQEQNEGPLDMSKSSLNFSGGLLTPSSSNSSSKSSSLNSSGLSMLPFLNYGQLMPDSDVLDMSTPRYGDSKVAPHPPGDITFSLRKSPLHPDTSFGNTFSTYPLHFSTATPLSTPTAGPSSSTPNTNTSMSPFPKSSNLAKKKVASRQGFPCTVCNRVFSYQTALFTHMHTHSPSARSYRCQLCNETFARAPDLKVHVCPNGMEKPYSCPSCGQTFAKNIHLKRHLATHSGLKPYPCWVCGKRFSRSDHLKRHTQSIHAGARPHVCQVCGKEFVRKYELNKHMQSHEQTFPVT